MKKKWLLILVLVVLLVGGGYSLYSHLNRVTKKANTSTVNTNSKTSKNLNGSNLGSSSSNQTNGTSTLATPQSQKIGAPPTAPSGEFVSNHKPGANGSPETEVSICNVSPGVSCQISFTMGSTVVSLQPQVAGTSGSVVWNNWTPASIGLTSGTWTIKATATYNGYSSTTQDQMALIIE